MDLIDENSNRAGKKNVHILLNSFSFPQSLTFIWSSPLKRYNFISLHYLYILHFSVQFRATHYFSISREIQLVKLLCICFVHLTILTANGCTKQRHLFIQIFWVNTNTDWECVKIAAKCEQLSLVWMRLRESWSQRQNPATALNLSNSFSSMDTQSSNPFRFTFQMASNGQWYFSTMFVSSPPFFSATVTKTKGHPTSSIHIRIK